MTTEQLQKIYAESRAYVQLTAYLQLAIACVLVVGGTLMTLFVLLIAKVPAIVGAILMLICTGMAAFKGWKGYTDLKGKPIVVSAEILKKEIFTAGQPPNETREYYLHLDIDEAYSIDSEGKTTALRKLKGKYRFSASDRLWAKVSEGEKIAMVATQSRMLFARISDLYP
ncbi:hypothetical protein [Pseudanabaena sp. 'Roaring Creek']|uniref:hypothetical protein n=1 Tax=Pseudanabaena sp. 'Roaring Creek' TaxID=1681830 RepID=UPI0006D7E9B7|nr:hypothetical protein [Pseudanabaena sp. 'Roaring Creek']